MAFFEWEDRFSVNVAQIDQQHQRLFKLINDLHEAIARSNSLATMASVVKEMDTVTSVIRELMSYAEYHFGTEECYMSDYSYSGRDQHQTEHQDFIKRVHAFEQTFSREKTRLSIDIAEFLREWWRGHILGSDKKVGAFLNREGLR
jgi:hemerythrin